MQPNDKPKEKGRCAARVEFLAVREDVQRFLAEGHSLRAIYDFYKEKGTFTMRYQTFCKYVAGNVPTAGSRTKKTAFLTGAIPNPAPAVPSAVKPGALPPERPSEAAHHPKAGPKILETPTEGFNGKLQDDNF